MRSFSFLAAFFLFATSTLNAQAAQFAVVRPDGTTFICPTLDSAYNKAVSGDYIYLPGGSFNLSNTINKSIHIIGAGADEDSSYVTGPTILNNVTIVSGGSNGSIEGIKMNNALSFEGTQLIFNYTIKRCYLGGGIGFLSNTPTENINVTNCFLGASSTGGSGTFSFFGTGSCNNSTFYNNVISSYVNATGVNNFFSNNLFTYAAQFSGVQLFNSSNYQNNIFQPYMPINSSNSLFYNNINLNISGGSNTVYNSVAEPADSTFINPGTINQFGWFSYNKNNNYRLRVSSLGKNSGTDGTDRGIYGGPFPWVDGSVPSNPHIYFKQVAPTTNANGQLPVQFKVRTNN